jgi:MFS family permease
MTLSVLTYALFSGACGLATDAWQVSLLRFISALGMGGEWSLGVALVMEIWPNRSRALLAGLIGAAANFGYMLIAVLGLGLGKILGPLGDGLRGIGLPESWVAPLVAHSGWRLLMLLGATPALLTFFIRLFVPESQRWEQERERGATSHWASVDLLGVAGGLAGASLIIYVWTAELGLAVRLIGSLLGLGVVTAGYLYPIVRYLQRSEAHHVPLSDGSLARQAAGHTLGRMVIGACLSGVALLGTWASIQWASVWADQLSGGLPEAKAYTQMWSAAGAILGTIGAAYLGDWLGRRVAYTLLCLASLASSLAFFQLNTSFGPLFLFTVFLAGASTASFYGWLPLYLPELFPTRVRATGQGFAFNFGRILAAVGVLQTGNLMGLFKEDVVLAGLPITGGYPLACSAMSLVYLVGLSIIWLAPETKGKPLPE